jgi:hypothetical protein
MNGENKAGEINKGNLQVFCSNGGQGTSESRAQGLNKCLELAGEQTMIVDNGVKKECWSGKATQPPTRRGTDRQVGTR